MSERYQPLHHWSGDNTPIRVLSTSIALINEIENALMSLPEDDARGVVVHLLAFIDQWDSTIED